MYKYAAVTDIGPVAERNDDRIFAGGTLVEEGSYSGASENTYFYAALCDGVGGRSRGDIAAAYVLRSMAFLDAPDLDRQAVRNAIENANTALKEKQIEAGMPDGMRTTLVGLYFNGKEILGFNAGDSRAYFYDSGMLVRMSKDHSVVQNMIDTGEITEEEAMLRPDRNIITKCIGESEKVNARIIEYDDEIPENSLFMMCSDGVTDCLEDSAISRILGECTDLTEGCHRLIEEAKKNGSTDNISVCLIKKEN